MANSTSTMERLASEAMLSNDGVQSAVRSIVDELKRAQSTITEVRPPREDRASSVEDMLERAAEVRGRGMYYPYFSAGVGNGPLVELTDGSVKYDLISGIGVHFFGHSDPDLTEAAIEGALADTVMQGNLQMNDDAILFAETLAKQASRTSKLKHAFLSNSGAMANENALKIAFQKHAPACRVIAFQDCFMGRTWTMAQLGDSAAGRVGLPLNTMVDYMPFYDGAAAKAMSAGDVSGQTRYIDMCRWHLEQYINRYPKQHACFVFELIQGEGGFRTAPREFHVALMEVCRDNDIAVWTDEVQTFGRTEQMFCFESLDLGEYIDICSVGKMSQVCATLYTADYNPKPGLIAGTFQGSSVGLRVGRRVIERLRDGDYYGPNGSNAKHHARFREGIRAIAKRHPEWFPANDKVLDIVEGAGGMMRFTPFGGAKEPVVNLCKVLYDEGAVTFYCGHDPYHVRMLPPLGVMDDKHWDPIFEIVERALAKQASSM